MVLRTLTGRLTAWLVLVLALLAGGAVIAGAGETRTTNDPTAALPAAAESTRVAALQRQLPSGQENPALVVYSRDGQPLTAAITTDAAQELDVAPGDVIVVVIKSTEVMVAKAS